MPEMVERVAQALHEHISPEVPWQDLSPSSQAIACRVARVAIKAMREPTKAMVLAAENADVLDWSSEPGEGLDEARWDDAWRAMIDAALS